MTSEGFRDIAEEVPGGIMQEARSRAAKMGAPGCYAFTSDRRPVTRLAENGLDQIIDWPATEAKYALSRKRIDPG